MIPTGDSAIDAPQAAGSATRPTWLPLALVNAAGLAATAAAAWTFGGATASPACDVYCGPAPSMFVALAIVAVAFLLWLGTVVFDVLVLVAGRPSRHWGLLLLAVQVGTVLAAAHT
ncbi:hypothetical protein [Frondihabitans australicus]|uniref:Uncharacterized protein n=1 Tax=Frondihabitans australicus TaxID=386892 RepID=A0A495IIZ1_9MICO|nr:hypothetical protein [Frondihabitans australicus]RKR75953.1 hypothetical protein C8E83_3117 [Frondihabitans australicus]